MRGSGEHSQLIGSFELNKAGKADRRENKKSAEGTSGLRIVPTSIRLEVGKDEGIGKGRGPLTPMGACGTTYTERLQGVVGAMAQEKAITVL